MEENIEQENKKFYKQSLQNQRFYREKKFWVILVVFSFLLIGSVAAYVLSTNKVQTSHALVSKIHEPTPTPTPIPFYEITIPYLREHSYNSSLGELKKVSENTNYISYLTSYDSDGLRINGLLTQPKGDKPLNGWPAIIFLHGYIPPSQYQTLTNYSSYVDYLARSGFVVFKIDLRGHGESEGEPSGAYYSSDYVIDTLNAYSALQSTSFVDSEKIGLWGHSMAGNVVFRAFAAKPDIPAVGIWAGAVYSYLDFREYGISDASYQPRPTDSPATRKRNQLFEAHGSFDPQDSFWKMVVPTNYVSDVKGAVQINHAVNDNVVSIEYSRNLMRILDGTDIIHELREHQSGGHNITGDAFNQAMRQTVLFFNTYLREDN